VFSKSRAPSRTWKPILTSKASTSPKPFNTGHWIEHTGARSNSVIGHALTLRQATPSQESRTSVRPPQPLKTRSRYSLSSIYVLSIHSGHRMIDSGHHFSLLRSPYLRTIENV